MSDNTSEPPTPAALRRATGADTGAVRGTGPDPRRPGAAHVSRLAQVFGPEDRDAVHATRLREVQHTAVVRAAWLADAVAHDLDTSDPTSQWALFTNGVEDDARAARARAEHAGVDTAAIAHAEELGSSGIDWAQQPADPMLARLEQLCHDLLVTERLVTAQHRHARELTEHHQRAQSVIEDLREDLAHAENALHNLLADATDHQWATGTRRRHPTSTPTWLTRLRDAQTALVAAPPALAAPPPDPAARGDAVGIGDAVDTVLPDTGASAWPDTPADQSSPDAAAPNAGPSTEPGAQP
ncbi:hypothetical protein [Nocardia wallacei]|uniref:hypothetical protein n=1 Tax=Nocardia wallacei TaxID=480035 RepID=UPI002459095A|nr:hypothetical protein [Nocardia wallacei]